MDFSIVKLFPDNLIKALCDTLIHSLWQGLILAGATGLIIVFTRKSAAKKRYNLLITALALFATGTICTFVIAINHAPISPPPPIAYNQGTVLNVQPVLKLNNTTVTHQTSITENAISYFNKNAATIVLIWFMIVCARCLQLATGLQGIYYLRRKNIFKVDSAWENRVQELAQNLGIRRIVSIVESGVAQVPMVVGHLKPLILIPVGLLTAVPSEEIEAILVHELAHIRRSDYLVNLLQSLMEIVFFFNPAVLWISALIKTERENCCDDIAVAQSSSKVNYIKALVSCQEYNASSPAYAMALKGNKNHLKDRVTRIISNSNHSLNRVEKSLLAICLVTAGLFTAAFTNAEKINKLVTNTAKAVMHKVSTSKKAVINDKQDVKPVAVKTDTTTKGKLRIYGNDEFENSTIFEGPNYAYTTRIWKEKGILYQLNYKNGALISMQVNGKSIPSNKIDTYQPVINQILNKFKINYVSDNATVSEPEGNAANDNKQGLATLDSITQKLKANNQPLNGSLGKLNSQSNLNLKRDQATADSVNQQYKSSGQEYKKSAPNGAWTKPVAPYQPKSAYGNPVKPYAPKGAYAPNSPDYKSYDSTNENKERDKIAAIMATEAAKENNRRDKVIAEMITDGIIQSKDNLSFKISTSEFIVNGKKQPDVVYQKYRAKYVKIVGNGEWSWLYNYDTDAKRESNTVTDKSKN